MTFEPRPDGGRALEAALVRPPAVYLDLDSLSELARRPEWRNRFVQAFGRVGTLLFSWTHSLDITGPKGRSADLLCSLLDSISPYWVPLELNILRVVRRENGWEPRNSSPGVSVSFLEGFYLGLLPYGEPKPYLGRVFRLNDEDPAQGVEYLSQLKEASDGLVGAWREVYKRDPTPETARRMFPPVPFDETKPATFALNELGRVVTVEARSRTWMPNDGVDFFHAVMALAYGDIVALDKQWKARAEQVPLPSGRCKVFYRPELAQLVAAVEQWPN